MKKFLILILIFFSVKCYPQKKYSQSVFAIKFHYGSIVIHTPSVKNVAGAKPFGTELEYSKLPMDSVSFKKCNCFPRNGIALSYFNFNSAILGQGTMLSYFIEPSYNINKKIHFNLRGAAGLVYATKPFNEIKYPENKSYTTHINPYLQVGLGLGFTLNTNIKMMIMANFQHFSNGAYKEPNRGVNWATGSIGLLYYSKTTHLPYYTHVAANKIINKKVYFDAGIFLVPKQGFNSKIMAQSNLITGLFIQSTKQYGRISALTGGLEYYYNALKTQSYNISRFVAGLHAGHAFIMGRVIFSQQAGYNFYATGLSGPKIYLRYGLLYRVSNHLLTGINLKAHADNADFTDFRVMYRF